MNPIGGVLNGSVQLAPGSAEFRELLEQIAEGAGERDLRRENPVKEVRLLAEGGVGAWRLPLEAGGLGLSLRELLDVTIELGRADSNVAHALRSHFLITESRRHLPGDRWVAAAARGELFGLATAERATQRIDSRDYATTLTPIEGGWVLNGEKAYCTGALFADWIQVSASLPDGEVKTVFVHHDAHGVVHQDDWDGFGQRLTASGTTLFRDVFVPSDHVLHQRAPRPDGTLHQDYRGTFAQLYLQAVLAGVIAAAADAVADVIRGRTRTFTHASAEQAVDDPLLQHIAGQIDGFAYTARAAVLLAAESVDAAAQSLDRLGNVDPVLGHNAALNVARVKGPLEELGARATYLLFEAGGASTTAVGRNLDRHWRNVRTLASHNPTVFKTRAVGQYLVSGTPVPANGFF